MREPERNPFRVGGKGLREELEAMKDLRVIEPSMSKWSSPVPKKDGSLRFCLNFRKLNSISWERRDTSVHLTSESRELTAFKTPCGHYQFSVLPFGLRPALPAMFQRMMDRILRGTEGFAAAYLDDIIVYSHNWEQHLHQLQEVLTG